MSEEYHATCRVILPELSHPNYHPFFIHPTHSTITIKSRLLPYINWSLSNRTHRNMSVINVRLEIQNVRNIKVFGSHLLMTSSKYIDLWVANTDQSSQNSVSGSSVDRSNSLMLLIRSALIQNFPDSHQFHYKPHLSRLTFRISSYSGVE